MKKTLCLVVAVLMLFTFLIPAGAFAEGNKELQSAIETVKKKLSIPSNLNVFTYSMNSEGTKKIWNLSWSSKNENDGVVNVGIGENGTIYSYYYYSPSTTYVKKLPKVSKKEAKVLAENFITKLTPGILSQLKFQENYEQFPNSSSYSFNYLRLVNGIPFYNNNISIQINSQTGNIEGYNYNWSEDVAFPKPGKEISMENAKKAFREKLGIKLIYSSTIIEDKVKTFPVYVSVYGSETCIDALTGDMVQLSSSISGPYYDSSSVNGGLGVTKSNSGNEGKSLSPQEEKAIEEASKLITREEAEKRAREIKVLDLSGYKVLNMNLSAGWPLNNKYIWNIYFTQESKDKTEVTNSAYVNIDAATGEVKGFSLGLYPKEDDKAKFDKAASQEAVEKFLKEFCSDKFKMTQFEEMNEPVYLMIKETDMPQVYNFNYVRRVNGISFPSNSLQVGFDATSGKITSYNSNWYEAEFAPVDKVLSADEIYKKVFTELGLELQYRSKYMQEYLYKMAMMGNSAEENEIKLVYAVKNEKPFSFDAFTGTILDSDGNPYKEKKAVEYSDIKGNYAEKQITALAEYGIALEGTAFKPNEKILQKDFLTLLVKIMQNYYSDPYVEKSKDKEIEDLYGFMIREGVIKAAEKAPESVVTREDSVKFIIRALKYNEVADIKGIFNCRFIDREQISQDLIGYVTIASGLGLINGYGNQFKPKDHLTRSQTAVMVYNYLQR